MGKMTIEDLAKIRNAARHKIAVRQGEGRVKIIVHMGTCGIAAGARGILTEVMKEIERNNFPDVIVTNAPCAGTCGQEPMMTVVVAGEAAPVKYGLLTPEKVRKIVDSHVVKGQVAKEFALVSERTR